jgi:aryl-phospho-beta-D-glucosidase BglC (GH1 family)
LRTLLCAFAGLLLVTGSIFAQQTSSDSIAFRRAEHLRHGINASEWFAQRRTYSPEFLAQYTTQDDIHLMRHLGFDHVRVSMDPDPLTPCFNQRPDALRTAEDVCAYATLLDKAVDAILADGLAVIVDVHPSSEFKKMLATDSSAPQKFAGFWSKLAARYANRDPERLFFEVCNEPELQDAYRWMGIQETAVEAIRRAAPQHTIIVAGARYSDIDELLEMQPLTDRNLIYNFHFYTPHIFTHQGASWGEYEWTRIHGLPYPATHDAVAQVESTIVNPNTRYHVDQYALSSWNAQHIAGEIAHAAEWGTAHHVPITCNEFGVYREYSDPRSRAQWIEDTRRAFEANHIGWTMWDYRGGFGVVTKNAQGVATPDENIVRALGLSAAR